MCNNICSLQWNALPKRHNIRCATAGKAPKGLFLFYFIAFYMCLIYSCSVAVINITCYVNKVKSVDTSVAGFEPLGYEI